MSDNNTTIQRTKQKTLNDVKKDNLHIGSSFDSFLEEEDIKEIVHQEAEQKIKDMDVENNEQSK